MKIDFYVLDVSEGQRALLFACKLIEQAHLQQQSVYVHMQSKQEAERLDKLLWTYKEDSFIPHHLSDAAVTKAAPIQIGFAKALPAKQEVLLNFSSEVPAFYAQFGQVVEIVFSDPIVQQLARERFKFYRSNSCDITTHKIKATEL